MELNKQFEEWCENHLKLDGLNHATLFGHAGVLEWNKLPFSMQWGVYLEFFDSVGILINIESDIFEVTSDYKHLFHVQDYTNNRWYGDRTEAQQEAIKQAFKILEQTETIRIPPRKHKYP